jgi:hypothetical protein
MCAVSWNAFGMSMFFCQSDAVICCPAEQFHILNEAGGLMQSVLRAFCLPSLSV